jgi:hypothetical protein
MRRKTLMFAGGRDCDKQLVAAADILSPPMGIAAHTRKILAPDALAEVDLS